MKMKRTAKRCAVLITAVLIMLPAAVKCAAADYDTVYSEQLRASGAGELTDILPGEAVEYLRRLGIEGFDTDSIYSASPAKVIDLCLSFLRDGLKAPLKAIAGVVGTVLLSACTGCFAGDGRTGRVVTLVSGCFGVLTVLSFLSDTLAGGIAAVKLISEFELALIPVFAGVVTAGGNPALALSYSSLSLGAAQLVERLAADLILPLCGCTLALGIVSSTVPSAGVNGAGEVISKTVKTALGLAAGLFSALLGLRGVVCAPADGMLSKGAKLALNSFVPVVGGALSEAYSTVAGSLSLLASAVGGFGMTAVFVLGGPAVIQLLAWSAVLKIGEAAAGLVGEENCAGLFRSIGSAVSMVNVLIIYSMAVFIISCGIILAVRTDK